MWIEFHYTTESKCQRDPNLAQEQRVVTDVASFTQKSSHYITEPKCQWDPNLAQAQRMVTDVASFTQKSSQFFYENVNKEWFFHVNLAHFFAPKIMAIRDTGLIIGISLEYSTGQSRYPQKEYKK